MARKLWNVILDSCNVRAYKKLKEDLEGSYPSFYRSENWVSERKSDGLLVSHKQTWPLTVILVRELMVAASVRLTVGSRPLEYFHIKSSSLGSRWMRSGPGRLRLRAISLSFSSSLPFSLWSFMFLLFHAHSSPLSDNYISASYMFWLLATNMILCVYHNCSSSSWQFCHMLLG